jgi:putative DNA primase/helicase
MNFESFAEQHGLIIDHIVHDRWTRVPTTDKPNSKNGAYIWDGVAGAVQNWALHEKPISFKSKEVYRLSAEELRQREIKKQKALETKVRKQKAAAQKARNFMRLAKKALHPYLISKGFKNFTGERGWVLNDMLIVPMKVDDELVGCQTILPDGTKRFLAGQRTKGAELAITVKGHNGVKGPDILCEGFATALSVRRAYKKLGLPFTVHVCFSAQNIVEIASKYKDCVIVADNDPVGLKIAQRTNRPYWVSPIDGEDFNDFEVRVGPIEAGKSLIAACRLEAS